MAVAAFIYSDDFVGYNFGPGHALQPQRLVMTYELLTAYGAFDLPGSRLVAAQPAREGDILLAHDPEYVEVVRRLSQGEPVANPLIYGFGAIDNPPFAGMYEASLLYVGASIQAAELVASGEERVAFNISGGLHHAMRSRASGFCIFNDPVIVIQKLLREFDKVAYVDIDAHHGDGVQDAFYTSNRVLTVSIHESGAYLFPGTGYVHELGAGEGKGFSVNLPLVPGSGDASLLSVFRQGALPILSEFDAPVIVAQFGADGHFGDPLAHLSYTADGWLEAVREILSLGKPTVALGGGGYDPSAVCRMWTLAYGAMVGRGFPEDIPAEFQKRWGVKVLRDDWVPKPSASDERRVAQQAARTLEELRRLVFPLWPGLPAGGESDGGASH